MGREESRQAVSFPLCQPDSGVFAERPDFCRFTAGWQVVQVGNLAVNPVCCLLEPWRLLLVCTSLHCSSGVGLGSSSVHRTHSEVVPELPQEFCSEVGAF